VASSTVLELDAEVLERLSEYVAEFMADFGLIIRRYWAEVYLQGLFLDGERKSIQPLAQRVTVPGWSGDTMQALQQFVNQSPWDEAVVWRTYRRVLAASLADPTGVIVIDDTGFAKKGRHSVGVARQYSGTLGKTDNCQVAVSLHYAAPLGDYPLGLRLFLPEEWTSQVERLQGVGVPVAERAHKAKGEIALELLDVVRGEGLPHQAVVADAGYGTSGQFRQALEARGETYVVGVNGQEGVFRRAPTWEVRTAAVTRGRPSSRWYVTPETPEPVSIKQLAQQLKRRSFSWRVGTKGALEAEFAWVRVWPAHDWQKGRAATDVPNTRTEARWLLVEWRRDGSIRYALSNLSAGTSLAKAASLWKTRWHVEQGYQLLKEELGLDHFEGRSWTGFHHHATLCCLAYGFLALERLRGTTTDLEELQAESARPFRV
jgi:SRSO17 transposase